jgi:EAL domain-containing protein (putative c-di-GMP-specific phosphodiesterase class I)
VGVPHRVQQLKRWEQEGCRARHVSINISPRQFMSRRLVPTLLAIVRETGADPRASSSRSPRP